jgi:hypothetical protein
MTRQRILAVGVTLLVAGALAYHFVEKAENTGAPTLAPTGTPAEVLIKNQCSRCHAPPKPEHLPKESWPFAIRWMGNYLGIQDLGDGIDPLVVRQYVPAKAMIHPKDLASIQAYFVALAKPTAEMRIERPRPPVTSRFRPRKLGWSEDLPLITFVHIDERRQRVLIGGYAQFGMCVGGPEKCGPLVRSHAPNGTPIWEHRFDSEPIHAENTPDGYRLTIIGSFREDRGIAQIIDLDITGDKPTQKMLRAGAHRLTQHITKDLDGDGLEDIVSIGFGDGYGPGGLGSVSVLWATEKFKARYATAPKKIDPGVLPGALTEQVLMQEAGPLNAVVDDFDADGRPDILLARAQGAQALILWRNKGNRKFEKITVKEWFVAFGLNRVRAADFDGDGDLDLLVVSGNNMEFPTPPLRPYHGLRVLENEGNLRFTEKFHYPFYGALDAVVRDFDNDGDPDIAAISFFLNWDAPEPFVYLENQGGFSFEASGLSDDNFGRWLRIAAGDVNGDGAPDVVLGSARTDLGIDKASDAFARVRKAPAVLVLHNNP